MAGPMDEARARGLLTMLAREIPGSVALWRGSSLAGSDVDVLVMEGAEHRVARLLRAEGLSPAPQPDGRVMWRAFDGSGGIIDAPPPPPRPPPYPSPPGGRGRLVHGAPDVPVAPTGDQLLVRAAELIGGREVDHIARKLEPLLSQPGARDELAAVAASAGEPQMAALVADPVRLTSMAVRNRIPYGRAAAIALCSR